MPRTNYAETIQAAVVEALEGTDGLSFNEMFKKAHPVIQEKLGPGGGEDLTRLRSYEQVQNLVVDGKVNKVRVAGSALYTLPAGK